MTTNPNTIPDEILKVARDIAASRYIGSQWSHMREYFADGLYDNDPVVVSAAKAIHDAVMAEREWRPIDTAPENRAILIHIPHLDYYGNGGVYAGMLVNMGTGRRWMTFGWATGRDLGPNEAPSAWREMPATPKAEEA